VFSAVCVGIAALWALIALLPWQPHRLRERLEAATAPRDLSGVTVLIPARNEARTLGRTLSALALQGPGLEVVVVDDVSTDDTARVGREWAERRADARAPADDSRSDGPYALAVRVVDGRPLPSGWGGKLWALQQGLAECRRRYTLLLDADIELSPHTIPALLAAARRKSVQLLSIMATLRCDTFWEKLLVPPFIFFFKLLYPFALVPKERSRVAAAAGGCMLVETETLRRLGGFEPIKDELIDDCRLAARFKEGGHRLWLGVSRSVRSLRAYPRLADFWIMVSRTAFTQLRCSALLLGLTTLVMALMFLAPLAGLFSAASRPAAASGIAVMLAVFAPTVRFYGLSLAWTLTLPLAACLYLGMTWSSAIGYWRGTRAQWKDRRYDTAR
jgi:hopene-associated glycosyltransferase HpnB